MRLSKETQELVPVVSSEQKDYQPLATKKRGSLKKSRATTKHWLEESIRITSSILSIIRHRLPSHPPVDAIPESRSKTRFPHRIRGQLAKPHFLKQSSMPRFPLPPYLDFGPLMANIRPKQCQRSWNQLQRVVNDPNSSTRQGIKREVFQNGLYRLLINGNRQVELRDVWPETALAFF